MSGKPPAALQWGKKELTYVHITDIASTDAEFIALIAALDGRRPSTRQEQVSERRSRRPGARPQAPRELLFLQ
ncbi:hypothetical protein J4733_11860 [Klebsiella pneumoniae]|uniref:Uncharacterized protein n=1 Tax=Klebsiella pneumoniae TaxID=573 RepID=A0A939NLL8_KLEPN|nr:hypothetical protein [Klebsiella pneumoniae]